MFKWKGVSRKVDTEVKFYKYIEMRNAYENGDMDTYNSLKTELGLWQKKQDGSWYGKGKWNWKVSGRWN